MYGSMCVGAHSLVHELTYVHTLAGAGAGTHTNLHTQRLYGKLDADSELPEVEDIEAIMAATIKQTTHEPDQGAAEDQLKPSALKPPPHVTFAEKVPAREGDDEGVGGEAKAVSDGQRREMLRTERRKRMADREAARGMTHGGVTFSDQPSFDDTFGATDSYEGDFSGDSEANPLSRTAPGALVAVTKTKTKSVAGEWQGVESMIGGSSGWDCCMCAWHGVHELVFVCPRLRL